MMTSSTGQQHNMWDQWILEFWFVLSAAQQETPAEFAGNLHELKIHRLLSPKQQANLRLKSPRMLNVHETAALSQLLWFAAIQVNENGCTRDPVELFKLKSHKSHNESGHIRNVLQHPRSDHQRYKSKLSLFLPKELHNNSLPESALQFFIIWLIYTERPGHHTDWRARARHLTMPWCPLWRSWRISGLMQWGITIIWPLRINSTKGEVFSLWPIRSQFRWECMFFQPLCLALTDEIGMDRVIFLFPYCWCQPGFCGRRALKDCIHKYFDLCLVLFFVLCETV